MQSWPLAEAYHHQEWFRAPLPLRRRAQGQKGQLLIPDKQGGLSDLNLSAEAVYVRRGRGIAVWRASVLMWSLGADFLSFDPHQPC